MPNGSTYSSCDMGIFGVHKFSQPKVTNNCLKLLPIIYLQLSHHDEWSSGRSDHANKKDPLQTPMQFSPYPTNQEELLMPDVLQEYIKKDHEYQFHIVKVF